MGVRLRVGRLLALRVPQSLKLWWEEGADSACGTPEVEAEARAGSQLSTPRAEAPSRTATWARGGQGAWRMDREGAVLSG